MLFKLYHFGSLSEYILTPSETVTFQNQTNVGEPSNPVVLSYSKLIGDANDDGEVDAYDIVVITNFIMGKNGNLIKEDTDVNGDGVVNIADIIKVSNAITGK